MDELIADFSLTELHLSGPLAEGLALHCNLAQPQNNSVATSTECLAKFASEECFDQILHHLASTIEALHAPSPTRYYTRKVLDSTTLFTICRVLHRAKILIANTGADVLLGSLDRPEYVDSESSLDPQILPLILRRMRPWRLEDPWSRTVGDDDVGLAKLDAVKLATALAALANNSRSDLEDTPIYPGPLRLRIKWLGRVDSDDAVAGPTYDDFVPCNASFSPNIEPEIKDDESNVRPPTLDASLFRSGCVACRLPRQTPCPRLCNGVQQRNKPTTNARPVNTEAETQRSRPIPLHPHNKDRIQGRSTTSESVTVQSKPIASIRSAPKRSKEADTKENISPAIRRLPRHQDSSAYRDTAAPSVRVDSSQAQTTIPSVSARPALSSNVISHEKHWTAFTSLPGSSAFHTTARTTIKRDSRPSALRSSSSNSTSRPISKQKQRGAKPEQLIRSKSLQHTATTVPSGAHHLSKAVKDQNVAQLASSLGPARILGQRNR